MEECGPCPVFASFTLAFALQLRKKHGKPSVRVRKTSVRVQYKHYKKTTHYKTHTYTHIHTHTLQNNIKPPQYKLKQNAHRKSNTMCRKNSTHYLRFMNGFVSSGSVTGEKALESLSNCWVLRKYSVSWSS
jgi:hypothetical protein